MLCGHVAKWCIIFVTHTHTHTHITHTYTPQQNAFKGNKYLFYRHTFKFCHLSRVLDTHARRTLRIVTFLWGKDDNKEKEEDEGEEDEGDDGVMTKYSFFPVSTYRVLF